MDSQKLFLVFLYLSSIITLSAVAQPGLVYHSCRPISGNYTPNSIYQNNLNTLLSSLSPNLNQYGFYNASVGQSPNRVSAIALCRGDVELDICRSCVKDAAWKLVRSCPNHKAAFGGYNQCMIRYSDDEYPSSIIPMMYWCSLRNVSNPEQFNQDLRSLLEDLRGPFLKFAAGNISGPDFQTIYAFVQCSPELATQDCSDCLISCFEYLPRCPCYSKIALRIVRPYCNFRYDLHRFFNYTVLGRTTPPPSQQPGKDGNTNQRDDKTIQRIIFIVAPIVAVVALTICIHIVLRKKKKTKPKNDVYDEISTVHGESLQYNFDTIRMATNNFSNFNKLGEGGFGLVYKGELPSGQKIAVKRLSSNSGQGDLEFKNEVRLVAKLQHRNLVRLLGFCLEGRERLLVYEFVPNASLDHFLFDPVKRAYLDWDTRYKIIVGISRGLLYLHEDSCFRIIHRDLKASNVLLDREMNPKISDLGMAKLFELDESGGSTSRIVGTYGYMAPEYAFQGQFSIKSDVFSFGVLALEIVSGQKNGNFRMDEPEEFLLSYAWTQWREGGALNLVDPIVSGNSGSVVEMMRCIQIALLCVQENVVDRPTMSKVVLMLNSSSMSLLMPSAPAFFMHSRSTIRHEEVPIPLLKDPAAASPSKNEASITDLYPR